MGRMGILLLAAGLGWASAGIAAEPERANLDRGWRAYLDARYSAALTDLRPLAENGDADAQYYLGTMYQHGHGVPRNPRSAAHWYEGAARQGHPLAQFALGFLLHQGAGEDHNAIYPDPVKAAYWLLRAAEQRVIPAQQLIGQIYRTGAGVPEDHDKALHWTLMAAEAGVVSAQFEVGLLLGERPGVENGIEAYKWFELAARSQYPGAAQNRNRLRDRLNTAEVQQAMAMADSWSPNY